MDTNINWERLKNVGPTLRPFEPTKERLMFLSNWLMKGFLNLSDENRTPEKVAVHISYYFPYTIPEAIRPFHLFYEIGDFAGLLGFTDIHIGHKTTVLFKYWDKKSWSHKIFRDLINVHKIVMEELDLQRISAETPDPKVLDLALRIGYILEARLSQGFRWDGKYYVNFLLRILKRDMLKKEREEKYASQVPTESSEEELNVLRT
jgi:hypothetical protein